MWHNLYSLHNETRGKISLFINNYVNILCCSEQSAGTLNYILIAEMSSLLVVGIKIVELCKFRLLHLPFHVDTLNHQTENIAPPLIFVLSIIWKVQRGTRDVCPGMTRLPSCSTENPSSVKTPTPLHSCTYHVQFLSIRYHTLHICTNPVWKCEFNGYCNECWLNGSEKQEEGDAGERREVCLDVRVLLGFTRTDDSKETWLFFPCAFPSYTREPSRTRRQGAPLIRIIRRFFTSDKQAIWLSLGLFEENMFLYHTPGSPTSGKSRSPLSTWHCFYAFVNIKAKRLG